jgi:tetratricopeptide (TPR) repeat protein
MAQSIDAALARAAQLTAAGHPHAAIELLWPVLAGHPEHTGAWCRLAAAYLDAGQASESLDAAKRAIVLGERSWAHRLASLALAELGRYEEAVISAREAVRRDPDDWRSHVALAESLGPVFPEDAVEVARTAVAIAPREARPHEVLGEAAARVQDLTLARRAYQDAIKADPDDEHLRAGLDRLTGTGRTSTATQPRPTASLDEAIRPVRFGRVQRTALWLVLRRVSVWLALGTMLLIMAGLPSPSDVLVWFGLALAALVLGLAVQGWFGLPHGARVALPVLRRAEPLAVVAVGLLAVAVLLLAVWTVALAFGSVAVRPLSLVLICSAGGVALGCLRLRRLRVRLR